MISRSSILLALLPVTFSAMCSGFTFAGFLNVFLSCMIIWVPYWICLWLSVRFASFGEPSSEEFRLGPQGFGYYNGAHRIY